MVTFVTHAQSSQSGSENDYFCQVQVGKSMVTHYCVSTINSCKMQVPHADMITTVLFFKDDLAKERSGSKRKHRKQQ